MNLGKYCSCWSARALEERYYSDSNFRIILTDLFQGLGVILGKLYPLPPFRGQMGALYCLDVEIQVPGGGVGADGCVAAVR
jgi:hypothetical protein